MLWWLTIDRQMWLERWEPDWWTHNVLIPAHWLAW